MIKTNALHAVHEMEARSMEVFHGWSMPHSYQDSEQEFLSAVSGAGLVDLSCIGRIEIMGKDVLDLLHRLSTNDLSRLKPGHVTGTLFTTDKGRLIDLTFVALLDESAVMLCSPLNEEKVAGWISKYTILEDVQPRPMTAGTCMLSLVGPRAIELAGRIIGRALDPNVCFPAVLPCGEVRVISVVTARSSTVHFIVPNGRAEDTWHWLHVQCGAAGTAAIGMEAWEMLRIATGMPGPGSEISDRFNPYDVGLLEFVSDSKGCYIGQEVIARIDTYQKVRRGLVGFRTEAPPPGVLSSVPVMRGGTEVGTVTSWNRTAIRGHRHGLAVVHTPDGKPGTRVLLGGNGTGVGATIAELPLSFA